MLNIFFHQDALPYLNKEEFIAGATPWMDLTLDFIDIPSTCILTIEGDELLMRIYERDEMKTNSQLYKELRIKRGSDFSLEDEEPIVAVSLLACKLCCHLLESRNMLKISAELDENSAGVEILPQGDEVLARVVEGRKRPDLLCRTLFGGMDMRRPYMDEIDSLFMAENTSLEVKIEMAEAGDLVVMESLAMLYLNGDEEVEADAEKAVYWLKKLAEAGDANGQFNLGLHYAKGHGVERDFAKAAYWMKMAAENGDTDAPALIEEYESAADNMQKAEAGDAQAQADVAGFLMKLGGSLEQAGSGQDYTDSFFWAEKAAAQGNTKGMWLLGLAYEHGRGTRRNKKRAAALFQQGADLGNDQCMQNLGCCYMLGEGVEKDEEKAFALFKKSAELGNVLAMQNLGRCYQFANGVEHNMSLAIHWYEKYLEQQEDEELARKVAVFKMLEEKDAPAENTSSLPAGYDEAMNLLTFAEENGYEEDAAPGEVFTLEGHENFVKEMAEAGNAEARDALEAYHATDTAANENREMFDEHLAFALPDGYAIRWDTNDDGDRVCKVCWNISTNEEGEEQAEFFCAVTQRDGLEIGDEQRNLDGNFRAAFLAKEQELQVMFLTFRLCICVLVLEHNGLAYTLQCHRTFREEELPEAEVSLIARHLSAIANSMIIDGERARMAPLTPAFILNSLGQTAEETEEPGDFPAATPTAEQQPHLHFQRSTRSALGALGGLIQVNAGGTEYSFIPLTDFDELSSLAEEITRADKGFPEAQRALTMSRIFRVSINAFTPHEDREQDIQNGYLRRAQHFHALRSFAWTLSKYCEANALSPAAVDTDTLRSIANFCERRNWLNYAADGPCAALCAGSDIHNFYLPDGMDEGLRKRFDATARFESGEDVRGFLSLDGLRAALLYLQEAMVRIHGELSAGRDMDFPLEGSLEDVLYAWCSLTYAARQPFFSEDGPVNCFYSHPDEQKRWEEELRAMREKTEQENRANWIKKYGDLVEKNPGIRFSGAKFVFAGVEHREDWPEILKLLTAKGALHRAAVSGQTNYLVCDPAHAGDGKVKKVQEQRIKGHHVKIVYMDDFFNALGYRPKDAASEAAEEPALPELPEVKCGSAPELSYTQGLVARGQGYEIDIPDGFVIRTDLEDRDFIAYLPGEDPEDYASSPFIIYAGKFTKPDGLNQFAIPEQYVTLIRSTITRKDILDMFSETRFIPYRRPDLPGGIDCAYDSGCLHVNLAAGMADGIQMLRLQISDVDRASLNAHLDILTAFFDHMRVDEPVRLAERPDAPRFTEGEPTEELAAQWNECVEAQLSYIQNNQALQQYFIVSAFENNEAQGNKEIRQLKKDLRGMLQDRCNLTEQLLKDCEAVYNSVAERWPLCAALPAMRDTLREIIEQCAIEFNINEGEEILRVNSSYAKAFGERLAPTPAEQQLQREKEEAEARAKAEAERRQKEEKERLRREREEQRRREEEEAERKRREQEEAERKRLAEEERIRLEREAQLREERRAKRKASFRKFRRISFTVILLAALLALAAYILIPGYFYMNAKTALEELRYTEAMDLYGKAYRSSPNGSFHNAEYMAKTGVYLQMADSYIAQKDYAAAKDTYLTLGDRDNANRMDYLAAEELFLSGDYSAAADKFKALADYNDAETRHKECIYQLANGYWEAKDYENALKLFERIKDYADSKALISAVKYDQALLCIEQEDYEAAYKLLGALGKDASFSGKQRELLPMVAYKCAQAKEEDGLLSEALKLYEEAGSYEDAAERKNSCSYLYAEELFKAEKYEKAVEYFDLNGYRDSDQRLLESMYQYVLKHKENSNKTTQNYLQTLVSKGYRNSSAIQNELYQWKVTLRFANSAFSSGTTSSISKYDTVYFFMKVSGGAPGETIRLKYTFTWPGYGPHTETSSNLKDGDEYYYNTWLNNPYYERGGTFTVSVYNAVTNQYLCGGSVTIY